MSARILFLTAPIGSGHLRAAAAVQAALKRQQPGAVTQIANVFDFFPAWMGRSILRAYLWILDHFPALYGKMYGWGNQSRLALAGREGISRILAGRMRRYIDSFAPDVIVCTHATPAGLMAWLVRNHLVQAPVVAVVTDFVVHRLWVYPELSFYFVANEDMRDFLQGQGVPASRSRASGIPVDAAFQAKEIADALRHKFNLTPGTPTVLIMGGGAGVLPMDEIVRALDSLTMPLQIVAVAGHNHAMRQRLESLALRHPLQVFGYIDYVQELMDAADILISKPGGMTSAEALCKGMPMLIYRPIPGQEAANTRFLTQHGAAVQVGSSDELVSCLDGLLKMGSIELQRMKEQAGVLGRPGAADEIAAYITEKYIP